MIENLLIAAVFTMVGFGLVVALCLYAQHTVRREQEQLESSSE